MYRNKHDITSDQGILIDAGSLWERKGNDLVLVDRDQHITTAYVEQNFIKVEP